MPKPVIVYSPDKVRGRIVLNTLRVDGIFSLLCTSHLSAQEVVEDHSPPVIIFDLKYNFANEISFLETLIYKYPKIRFIALAAHSSVPELKSLKLQNLQWVADPLDPESILLMVKDFLSEPFSMWWLFRRLKNISLVFIRGILKALPIAASLIIGVLGGYIYWCASTLPEIDVLENYSSYEASRLYSFGNILLTEFYVERRNFIDHENIPDHVKEAFVAVEDTRYYKHGGIDIFRIISALMTDIKRGAFIQGGSTITQQLAKMIFLKPEKTISRKVKEMVLSFQLEKRYTKDEILGFYLNKAYFGARAYGIEAASQAYFGKSSENLTVPEAALLAALPKAPSKYSPLRNPDKALSRRNFVLRRMYEMGFVTEKELNIYLQSHIPDIFHGRKYKAPYFVDYCRKVLEKKYGERLYTSGLGIFTTLDYRLQQLAERAVEKGLEDLKKRVGGDVQAALIAVDPKTGGIKAMVGGTNFWDSQFNRVTQALRQPGSAFKPIVYLSALDMGFKPSHTIEDSVVTYMLQDGNYTWTPRNYNEVYHSTVTLKTALARSLNAATVKLAKRVGIKNVIKTAKRLGIKSKIYSYYSSALGASELTLLELTYAYVALAKGKRLDPICTERIIDREKIFFTPKDEPGERVVGETQLADIRNMLRAVITEGTGRKAKVLGREVYGKTGTTNNYADAWFIGFDDKNVVGVWVGRDNRTPIGENETGSRAALPIWIEYMKGI